MTNYHLDPAYDTTRDDIISEKLAALIERAENINSPALTQIAEELTLEEMRIIVWGVLTGASAAYGRIEDAAGRVCEREHDRQMSLLDETNLP